MKIAIITDIHANLEALQAVLADIEKRSIQHIISLGDNIGYGPNPVEVLYLLHEREIASLRGNHDEAIWNPKLFSDANEVAIEAIEWTRYQISQAVDHDDHFQEVIDSYLEIPCSSQLFDNPQVLLVHGSPGPNKRRFDYLIEADNFLAPHKYMKKKKFNTCFFGHTHKQSLWEVDNKGVSLLEFQPDATIAVKKEDLSNSSLFINPGSVGQPRDHDPSAAYVIYESNATEHLITFCRVPYNVELTARKIYEIAYLDDRLADRLLLGS